MVIHTTLAYSTHNPRSMSPRPGAAFLTNRFTSVAFGNARSRRVRVTSYAECPLPNSSVSVERMSLPGIAAEFPACTETTCRTAFPSNVV